jgi:hypothetical protein
VRLCWVERKAEGASRAQISHGVQANGKARLLVAGREMQKGRRKAGLCFKFSLCSAYCTMIGMVTLPVP